MDKLFVPYIIAESIKEKGFNEPCLAYFSFENKLRINGEDGFVHNQSECKIHYGGILAPIYQQVIDWFEEKHNIHIDRIWYDDEVTFGRWVYHIGKKYAGLTHNEAIEEALKLI